MTRNREFLVEKYFVATTLRKAGDHRGPSHRLLKLQHEFVDLDRRAEDDRGARVVGIAEKVGISHEREAGRRDLRAKRCFRDAVIGLPDIGSVFSQSRGRGSSHGFLLPAAASPTALVMDVWTALDLNGEMREAG
jgi:hypothetical protein